MPFAVQRQVQKPTRDGTMRAQRQPVPIHISNIKMVQERSDSERHRAFRVKYVPAADPKRPDKVTRVSSQLHCAATLPQSTCWRQHASLVLRSVTLRLPAQAHGVIAKVLFLNTCAAIARGPLLHHIGACTGAMPVAYHINFECGFFAWQCCAQTHTCTPCRCVSL